MTESPEQLSISQRLYEELDKRVARIESRVERVIECGKIVKEKAPELTRGSGFRKISEAITFEKKYTQPPIVFTSLTGLDTNKNLNSRVKVSVKNISASGCEIEIETWGHTMVWFVQVDWLAMSDPSLDSLESS